MEHLLLLLLKMVEEFIRNSNFNFRGIYVEEFLRNVTKSCSYMMLILITSNKQSLFKRYGALMTMFSTNPYLILSNVSSVILHSLSRNCFTIKSNFYFYFRKCRKLHKNNCNQHIK